MRSLTIVSTVALLGLSIFSGFATTGCAATHGGSGEDEQGTDGVKQPEVWSQADDPAIFTSSLERKLAALPDHGEASTIPWAGNYWPTYRDDINYKWDGDASDSASKKYEKAFGGTGVEDAVSKFHGIDSMAAKECADDSVCDSTLGETCAKRVGQAKGKCLQTWMGICHAWTPASILLPEPKHAVTKNGVTFKVNDIKALATLVHNRTSSKFVSLRCNKSDGKSEIHYDPSGRPVEADKECRDTNPGTYHILLANYLGKLHQSFIEDRTNDYQVWNQPLRGYDVLQKKSLTFAEANAMLNVSASGGTTVNKSGVVAKDAWAQQGSFAVTPGSQYKVAMSGDGDADLYVKFGAEPTTALYDCRPYAGTTAEVCSGTVPAGVTKLYVGVNGYAATSNFKLDVTTGATVPSKYAFNDKAVAFTYLQTDVKYISESSESTDGNLSSTIDEYTRTDSYEYILELDATGAIIGGEWVGDSMKKHPDFVWLPLAVSQPSVAGGKITYAQVKELVDLSVASETPVPPSAGNEKTVTEQGTVAKGDVKSYGPYKAGNGSFSAVMTGTGDADLYVRKSLAPTVSLYDCRPYKNGSSEACTITASGDVYVNVRGYATTSTYSLAIKYTETP